MNIHSKTSFLGIPIAITAASNSYHPVRLEVITRFLQSRILILCFSLVLHYLTCMTIERFLTITLRSKRMSNHTVKKVTVIASLYVLVLWSVILVDDICDLTGDEKELNCTLERRMAPEYTSKSKVPVTIIAIWMTSCNAVLCTTTARTILYIKKVLHDSELRFGVSSKRVETKRLAVIYALSIFYTLIWVPYGIVSGRRSRMNWLLAKILEILFETICYASFFVLPFAFYIMDRRFWAFVKTLCKKQGDSNEALSNEAVVINRVI